MNLDIVYNEDFLTSDKIENETMDMVVTSPPYFNARDYSQWKTYEDYLLFAEEFINKCFSLLKDSGRRAINIPDGYNRNPWIPMYADYCKLMQKAGFILRGNIIWHKLNGAGKTSWGSWRSSSNPSFIDEHEMIIVGHKGSPRIENSSKMEKQDFFNYVHSVWQIKPETRRKAGHPAPFPVEIPYGLIEFLTGEGAIVLDPFMGSYTTAVACKMLNRHYVGFETVAEYCEMGEKRLKEFLEEQEKET